MRAVLLYHVLAGEQTSEAVVEADAFTTLQGQDVSVSVNDDGVFINGTAIVEVDLFARNGVIHAMGGVLLPDLRGPQNIIELLESEGNFTQLLAFLDAAELRQPLSGEQQLTLFCPQ